MCTCVYDCVTVKVGSDRTFTHFHIEIIIEGETQLHHEFNWTERLVGWQTEKCIDRTIGKQRDF